MRNVLTNTILAFVLALLAYLPFSVYRFENIKDIAENEKILSASTDSFGRYVSFGEKWKGTAYETAVFKVFIDKQVEYTDFYTITNNSNTLKEYEVETINSDYSGGFSLSFTSSRTNKIFVKPNETVGLTVIFKPTNSSNTTLSFIILEKGI